MALIPFADKTMQSSITTTTGAYQLTTNVGQFKTWRSQKADGTEVFYVAENSDASIWEEGFGTLTYGSPDTISRTTLLGSSTGSAIDWSGVTVYVMSAPVALAMSGRYVSAKSMWVPENRRPTTAVGAANKTIAAADVAGIFTLDNSAAARSITLPALSAVGEGFSFRFMGSSNATLLSLIPNGSEVIDFSSGGTTVKLPGKVWIDVWHDGSQWRTSYPYNVKTKILEYAPSGAASVDTGGSALPSWINALRIEWDLTPATNNVNLVLQLYDSTGTLKSGGADYYYLDLAVNTSGGSSVPTGTGSSILLAQAISNSATQNAQGFVECYALQAPNARAVFMGMCHGLDQAGAIAGQLEVSGRATFGNAITGFKLAMSSGNETGAVRVYANS